MGAAEMTATRSWLARRISAGPVARRTSATADSGTGRPTRVDHEVSDFLDGRGAGIHAAHQHVDLLFLQPISRSDITSHVRHDAIGDVAHSETELRGALLVEQDLDLGMAAFDAGADVLERAARFHARADGAGGKVETFES
jgi:hypothetical protein